MTGEINAYKYINDQAPSVKINYSYSQYQGEYFMDLWYYHRISIIQECPKFSKIDLNKNDSEVEKLFNKWIYSNDFDNEDLVQRLNLLIKRFEVTKKIYSHYDENFRALDKSMYNNLRVYLLFSFILIQAYYKRKRPQYLNALLKVNDILSGQYKKLDRDNLSLLGYCLSKELELIQKLKSNLS